jgi:glycosidase
LIIQQKNKARDCCYWLLDMPEVIFQILVDAFSSRGVGNPQAWQGGTYIDIIAAIQGGIFTPGSAILIPPVTPQVKNAFPTQDPWSGWPTEGRNGYWADRFMVEPTLAGGMDRLFDLINMAKKNNIQLWIDVAPVVGSVEASAYKKNPEYFSGDNMGLPLLDFTVEGARKLFLDLIQDCLDLGAEGFRFDSASHMDDEFLQGLPENSFAEIFNGDPESLQRCIQETGKAVLDYPGYFAFSEVLATPYGDLNKVATMLCQVSDYRAKAISFIGNNDQMSHSNRVIHCSGRVVGPDLLPEADQRTVMFLRFQFLAWPAETPLVWYLDFFMVRTQGMENPNNTNRAAAGDLWKMGAVNLKPIKRLIEARRSYPALHYGAWNELWRPNTGPALLVGVRTHDGETPVVVVVNNSNDAVSIPGVEVHGDLISGHPVLEVTGSPVDIHVHNGRLWGLIPAMTIWGLVSQ